MKTNKLAMIISAILTIVLGILSYVVYDNTGLYPAMSMLTMTALFAFVTSYIWVSSKDKKFS